MSLRHAARCGLSNIIVEGDSFCAIGRASGVSKAPWCLVDVSEKVVELGTKLKASFVHIKRSANKVADGLAEAGVGRLILASWFPLFFLFFWVVLFFCFLLNGFFFLASQYMSLMLICLDKIQFPFEKNIYCVGSIVCHAYMLWL